MNELMTPESSGKRRGLPEDIFEMEIISNRPNNVELNEGEARE